MCCILRIGCGAERFIINFTAREQIYCCVLLAKEMGRAQSNSGINFDF